MFPKKKPCFYALWLLALTLIFSQSIQARVFPDRTRIIFKGDKDALVFSILNDDTKKPFLAQSWLEDEQGKKFNLPFTVQPPLQRLEADSQGMVKILATPKVNELPQDRESLYIFKLREIPPVRSDKDNQDAERIRLNVQSKIKMFYRPEKILSLPESERWKNISIKMEGDLYRIKNPTPFYLSVTSFSGQEKNSGAVSFFLIPPFEEKEIRAKEEKSTWLNLVDDYGARKTLRFSCKNKLCHVV